VNCQTVVRVCTWFPGDKNRLGFEHWVLYIMITINYLPAAWYYYCSVVCCFFEYL
jgi:hypothetical protein